MPHLIGLFYDEANHRGTMDGLRLSVQKPLIARDLLAQKYPRALEIVDGFAHPDGNIIAGLCDGIADELTDALQAAGIPAYKEIGWYAPDKPRDQWAEFWLDSKDETDFSHAWVVVNGIIIDPTASQFGGAALEIVDIDDPRYAADEDAMCFGWA